MNSFKQMIANKEIKRADAMRMRLQDLHEENGFNLRDPDALDDNGETLEQSIERLADFIAAGGQYPALEVRPRDEGGVWIVEGHRRMRAVALCVRRGVPMQDEDGEVRLAVVAFKGNDADRTLRIITSRQGRSLSPLEVARGYARLRSFGWDNTRIAAGAQKTPQHVAQLLTLADANSDVQQMVATGGVSAALAVQLVRGHGDDAGKVLAEATDKAHAQGKKKVTAATLTGKSLPRKVVDEVEDAVKWFVAEMQSEALWATAQVEINPAQYADAMVSVKAGVLAELIKAAALMDGARKRQEERARDASAKTAQLDIQGV